MARAIPGFAALYPGYGVALALARAADQGPLYPCAAGRNLRAPNPRGASIGSDQQRVRIDSRARSCAAGLSACFDAA